MPTVATQLSEHLDVEALSRELADIAKREREEKQKRVAAEAATATAAPTDQPKGDDKPCEEASAQDIVETASPLPGEVAPAQVPSAAASGVATLTETGTHAADALLGPGEASLSSSPSPEVAARRPPALSPPSLNPAAPAFQPRFAPAPSPPPPHDEADFVHPATALVEEFPSLSNGPPAAGDASLGASSPKLNGHAAPDDPDNLTSVGKSWADIVKENAPSAENGRDDLSGRDVKDEREGGTENERENRTADGETEGRSEGDKEEVAQEPQVDDALSKPQKSKAELWREIKTLCMSLPLPVRRCFLVHSDLFFPLIRRRLCTLVSVHSPRHVGLCPRPPDLADARPARALGPGELRLFAPLLLASSKPFPAETQTPARAPSRSVCRLCAAEGGRR